MRAKIKSMLNEDTPGETLSKRAVRGGFWVFSLRGIEQLFNIARLIILARILAPHDFGLLGIALLTMMTLETFSQTGFNQALIQKKKEIKPYLDSAWTVSILRGIILFAILYLIAPYAASFFEVPEAKLIIQVIGLSILFQAFTNIGVIYFQKELKFKKQFVYQLSGTLVDFIVAVSAALILQNVWALVFGMVAGNFVRCIGSYLIHSYRPHLSLDIKKIKELFGFGKWIMGSSILMFLITQGDDIFVGKLLGVTALAFYQMAYKISNISVTEVTYVISQVTFPAYSKLQDDLPKFRKAYFKVLQIIAFLSIPIAGLIFVLAPDFTKIFLGDKWIPIVSTMQLLAIFGAIRSLGATLGPVYSAKGRPDYPTKLNFMRLILIVIIIYPLTVQFGIFGTALTVLLATIVQNIVLIFHAKIFLQAKLLDFGKCLFFPLSNTICMGILLLIGKALYNIITIESFVVLIIIGPLIYLGLTYIVSKFMGYTIFKQLKGVLNYG